jgi:hypothetical protein
MIVTLNNTPAEFKEVEDLRLVIDYNNNNLLSLSPNTLTFVRESNKQIKDWITNWSAAALMPMRLSLQGVSLDYLLDFPASLHMTNYEASVTVKRRLSADSFKAQSDALVFSRLSWYKTDFREVEFQLVDIDKANKNIMLLFMLLFTTQTTISGVLEASKNIQAVVKAATPVGIPPAPDWGAIIVAAMQLLASLGYIAASIAALIKIFKEFIQSIYPKTRRYKCATVLTLIKKGVEYLGYTLSSTLLSSMPELVIIPVPARRDGGAIRSMFLEETLASTTGYPTAHDTTPTLGSLINAITSMFNAEVRVLSGVVHIEKRSTLMAQASPLMTSFNDKEVLTSACTLNSSDWFKRLVIKYSTDTADITTLDDADNSIAEASTELLNSPHSEADGLSGYVELNIPFARASRKKELNGFESILRESARIIDNFLNTNLTQRIESRKGVMQLSGLYYGVTKVAYLSGSRLSDNSDTMIGAAALMKHHEDRFVENNTQQQYAGMVLPMSESEFLGLLQNNFKILPDGSTCEVVKAVWSPLSGRCEVDYNKFINNNNILTQWS